MAWKSAFRSRRREYNHHYLHSTTRRKTKAKLFYKLGLFAFFGVLGLFIFFGLFLPIFAFNLPSPDKVVRREGFSTKIYDRNGTLLYDIYNDQRRTPIKVDEIPETLKKATIAIEDKNFYEHSGFDPFGMFRGLTRIVTRGRAQGGSTLTQQLVKNVLLTSERTLPRKVKEFALATQIESKYSKDEILTMYLNEAPYGGTCWGVECASESYFGKSAKELNLLESAILAGLPQRPSTYSPYSATPEAYKERTKQVLRRMREDKYISKDQEAEAVKQLAEIKFVGKAASFKAPHFVTYIQGVLEERYGESVLQSGMKVTTTLDWGLQEKAQQVVSEEIAKVEGIHITNGASVAIDPNTGEILAMVGSKDFSAQNYDGQVNVTLALRQPGSAIKPVTYLAGLKKGYTASTMIMDVPTEFPGGDGQPLYTPVNYDGKYRGPVQVRYALANSLNVPAVKMLAMVGVKNMLTTAYDLGFKTLEPTDENMKRFGLSVTLGGGEVRLLDLVSSYSAFANGGEKFEPVSILKVEDSKGKVLEEFKPDKGKRVISEGEAFIISHILSDNQARSDAFGPNSALHIPGRQVAAKTGTTNDRRDNWTVGWTPNIVVGVWVGNNDNSPMKQLSSGISGAAPIWRRIILEAMNVRPNESFKVPDSVVTAEVDKVSGYRAHDGYPSRIEYFVKGTEPDGEDPIHTRVKVCRSDGNLATPSQVSAGEYDEKEYYVIKEDDPTNRSGSDNKWMKGILDWINTQTDSRYKPPRDYCGNSSNPISVQFITPKDHQQVNSNSFEVRVDPQSTSDIVQVEFEIDGKKVATLTSAPWKVTMSDIKNGTHEIIARAKDRNGKEADGRAKIGVNVPWDATPTPTP